MNNKLENVQQNKYPTTNNLIYKIDIIQLDDNVDSIKFEEYKFKDLGYLVLFWAENKNYKSSQFRWKYHGFITVSDLKKKLGEKQYSKFCQGKREFIIQ